MILAFLLQILEKEQFMRSGCRLLNKQVSACETLKTEHLCSRRIGRALVLCHVTLAQVNKVGGTCGCIVTYPLGTCHSDRLKRKKNLAFVISPTQPLRQVFGKVSNNELCSVSLVLVLIANKADWIQLHGKLAWDGIRLCVEVIFGSVQEAQLLQLPNLLCLCVNIVWE